MRTVSILVITAAALTVAAAGGVAWWVFGGGTNAGAGEAAVLRPDDVKLTSRGETLYREHCASCHGAKLEGQANWRERGPDGLLPAPPHDASGHTWHHPDDVLIRITRDGVAAVAGDPSYRTAMPVYRGVLTDEEIVAVLSWIKSQWPADIRARHDKFKAKTR